jgi:hypothetical protein
MKKKLFFTTTLIIFAVSFVFAQEKIEKYCEVSVEGGRVHMNFGNPQMYFRDSAVKAGLLEVNHFNNSVDVLNYMSKLGWTFVTVVPYGLYSIGDLYYFKKLLINLNLPLKVKTKKLL